MKKAFFPLLMLLLLLVSMQSACAEQVSLVSIWNNFVCPNCGTKTEPDYDSTHHWLYCPSCKLEHYASCHYTACTDTVFCTVCNASGIYFDFLEHGEDIPKQDEICHWYQCSDCGALSNRELHTAEDGSFLPHSPDMPDQSARLPETIADMLHDRDLLGLQKSGDDVFFITSRAVDDEWGYVITGYSAVCMNGLWHLDRADGNAYRFSTSK